MTLADGYWENGVFCFKTRVYLEDVDAGGIVYHANHLKYAERARTELLAAGGLRHAVLLQKGAGIIVSSLSIKYLRPLRLEEAVLVTVEVTRLAAATADLVQKIWVDDELAADLRVELVYLSEAGKPARWPQALRQALAVSPTGYKE